jgi:acyl-coenzyme A thioesterase PaaI-like protein
VGAERCTAAGVLHGGYLMSLADTAAATLAYLNLPRGDDGHDRGEDELPRGRALRFVTARAELVHVGRRTIVVQADVTDDAAARVSARSRRRP